MTRIPDGDLLTAWVGGDRDAGQALVQRHYRTVFLFFHTRLDPDTSADLTQATFTTLCETGGKYRGASSFRSFLFGIARWTLVGYYRKRRNLREASVDDELDFVPAVAERSLTSMLTVREREACLVQALRGLTLGHQLLIELKEYEGFTAREIADALAIPPGTVATRLRRARKLLRERLEALADKVGIAELTGTTLQEHLCRVRASASGRA